MGGRSANMELTYGLVLIAMLFVTLLIGVPIAFAMGSVAVFGILLFMETPQLAQLVHIVFSNGTSGTLLVAPMFILMAEILAGAGISRDLFNAASRWFNWLPGGLAVTSIMACAGFASVTGSSSATVAAIGTMSVPEMLRYGYDRRLAAGAVVAGGTLGILIPPSLAMIVYGIVTGTSIVQLFLAGIVPGILTAALLSAYVVYRVRCNPSLAPPVARPSWRERFASLRGAWPVVLLAVLVLGAMYTGAATPTEAAGVGVVGALLIVAGLGRLRMRVLQDALVRSARTSAMVLFLVFGGLTFAYVVEYLNVPHAISDLVLELGANPWLVLAAVNVILLILGCFFDPISMLVLTMPFLFPIIADQGFDAVWFGVVATLNCEIGLITPPVGINLFVLRSASPDLSLGEIIRGSVPFITILLLSMVLLVLFPQMATWVVR